MNNILYLDDYINFYISDTNELKKITPYKNTLRNGVIIDRNRFLKKIVKELNKMNIKNSLFNNSITIIINNIYTKEDKLVLKEVMEELNYKNIIFKQEVEFLNINKSNIYINCNYNYFYLIYTDSYGDTEVNLYKNDLINKNLFINIIDSFKDKNIILYGKNVKEYENILIKYKKEYFIFEEYDNLIIKILLSVKRV